MGLPYVQTIVAAAPAGAQAPYAADWMQSPFDCTWSLEGLGSTTGTYSIEYTMDDVNAVASPTWTQIVPANQTINRQGQITFPVMFLRVNFSVGPVGGNCTFVVLQGMSAR